MSSDSQSASADAVSCRLLFPKERVPAVLTLMVLETFALTSHAQAGRSQSAGGLLRALSRATSRAAVVGGFPAGHDDLLEHLGPNGPREKKRTERPQQANARLAHRVLLLLCPACLLRLGWT